MSKKIAKNKMSANIYNDQRNNPARGNEAVNLTSMTNSLILQILKLEEDLLIRNSRKTAWNSKRGATSDSNRCMQRESENSI